jgi:hypothetical protein
MVLSFGASPYLLLYVSEVWKFVAMLKMDGGSCQG